MGGGVRRMKKLSLLLMFLMVLGFLTPAMAQEIYWAKEFKGTAKAIAITPDGDIIVAGYTYSSDTGSYDFWVLRLDENGNMRWQKAYGGGDRDLARAIAITPDGDIIVAGYTESFGAGGKDAWVLRLDKNGNVKWQKTYGGRDVDWADAVAIAPNGDIIVAGFTESFGAGLKDAWILRLDKNGNVKWQKTYGSDSWDDARALAIAPNGDIIVAGGTLSFGAGDLDVWVLRLDENGNVKWQKTYGGTKSDWAYAVAIAPNGDIIVAGITWSFGAGERDFWVLRLDENGNVKWQKTYGGGDKDEAYALTIAPDGDIIVVGATYSFGAGYADYWVLRLDENGNIKWQKTHGSGEYDRAYAVSITLKGDGVVGGDYVIKFNVDDAPLYEGGGWDDSSAIARDSIAVVKETNAMIKIPNAIVKSSSAMVTDVDYKGRLFWIYPPKGFLRINSTPSGAKVYVDGKYKGETPLELKLEPGSYTVKIIKEGYEDYETKVEVRVGEISEVNAVLKSYGILKVSSTPSGARVYVDGKYSGKTPLELKLEPGIYTVKITKEGYEDYETRVEVKTGKTAEVSAGLRMIMQTQSPGEGTLSSPSITRTTRKTETVGGVTFEVGSVGNLGKGLLVLVGLLLLIILAKGKKSPETSKRPTETSPKVSEEPGELKAFPKELLSKYEPLEFLGEGGFAKVFKVKRKSDGKIVALKIPNLDEKARKFFLKEVKAWRLLNHRNIVKLYNAFDEPLPHIEMEFVEGVKLDGEVIRDLGKYPKPVDEETALKLIRGIAEGLKHAHSKKVYHRDLKPQNVLITADLTPKITDWGLAKVGALSTTATTTKGLTLLYAAPEQLDEETYGHTDNRTDLYQLGLIFYELLTGKLPYTGTSPAVVMAKVINPEVKPKPPSHFNRALAKYDGIFEKLLAKRKEDRYQSVGEFLKDLELLRELDEERRELEEIIEKTKTTMSMTTDSKELEKLRRLVVGELSKLSLIHARLNDKAELINALRDLKVFSREHRGEIENAIGQFEVMLRESVPISKSTLDELKVLLHKVQREVGG